jgi:hypothetical protein
MFCVGFVVLVPVGSNVEEKKLQSCTHNYIQVEHEKLELYVEVTNTTGVTSGAETACLSKATEFTPFFLWGSCCSIFIFLCSVLYPQKNTY